MEKFRKKFSKSAWHDCCGKLCDDCKIADAYIKEYGEKKAKKRVIIKSLEKYLNETSSDSSGRVLYDLNLKK